MEVKNVSIDSIKPYKNNPRDNEAGVDAVANSIKQFKWQQPIVVDKDNVIIVGHTRYLAAKKLGLKEVPVKVATGLTPEQVKAYRLADNKTGELTDWNLDLLDDELDSIIDINMSDFGFDKLEDVNVADEKMGGSLADDFGVPPFSVIDTRQGEWQKRKKLWLEKGIKSEIGRKENLTFAKSINIEGLSGTSVFDPALTEIIYKWFTPHEGAHIYDPFAGGSVRGVVASCLGHNYTGIDLRQEQIDANYTNAKECKVPNRIKWYCDDSQNVDEYVDDNTQDLIIACPPYLDLEQYSDSPNDLSNMDDESFDQVYQKILGKAVNKLRDNRFAVIVVSDVRSNSQQTGYRDLTGMTKRAMINAGCCLYNEIILLNAVGSAAVRARRYMRSRKVARVHQEVLVFYKGDTRKIKDEFPEITGIEDTLEKIEEDSE